MRLALKVNNLKKSFGRITAVDGLSFEVYKGEIFGILGPNGAGKSTTLSIITGLVKPNAGDVTVLGNDLKKNFVKTVRDLGILVENPGFYNYLTGYENLRLFNRFKNARKREINYTLELVGLIDQKNRKVKGYSLGMRRRLGLANALLGNPKILVLDEPTNGLDPSGSKMILDLIRELSHREKISVIISSNLLRDIEAICNRALLINMGKKILCESVKELVRPVENSFNIKVTSPKDVFSFLKKNKGIKKIELRESDLISVVLSNISSGELNRLLVEKGYDVLEMIPVKRTLQELFLELER